MQAVTVNGRAVYPSKIVCIGRNYAAHIEELGNDMPDDMVIFNKPNSAITRILRASIGGEALHYESELAFVVNGGRLSAVGFGLDLTKRLLQSSLKAKGLPWERAKAFDGAALFSDFVALPDDIALLSLRLLINTIERQVGGVNLMIHSPLDILRELSAFTTLEDGDIIMTGTPAGVGQIEPGEQFIGQVLAGEQTLISVTWDACQRTQPTKN
jgi:2-keto-4-pentenoate hydratase/2-oxohepta-3-ene-1,7-dioic acid hydratase in catechol pathway